MKFKFKLIFLVSLLSQSTLSWAVDACASSSQGYIVSIDSNSNIEDFIGVQLSDDINGKINLRTFTFPSDAKGASIKLSLIQNAMVMRYIVSYSCRNNELINIRITKN